MLIRRSSGTTDDDQTKLRKCEWVMNYEYRVFGEECMHTGMMSVSCSRFHMINVKDETTLAKWGPI